eukprot:NODE_66_length_1500_cov_424.324619_g63_i0.p1 GENE.NODE_66_length_1500_cov_424.324619_g63_i0~~NODE_66_length_1500_cov_424.324619_g63_i0.p1  ORF type:complete len:454 (-),score=100.04 NODE_66_length_1500_cov_424.324619_g63_i0:137-1408(-)
MATVLADTEEQLEHLTFRLEETREAREQAIEDGEMLVAEKHYYSIVQLYEEIIALVIEKINTVDKHVKENAVHDNVRNTYQQKAAEEVSSLKAAKVTLKEHCEADLKKIFDLKEKVQAVELQTQQKMEEDVRRSESSLRDNSDKQEECWRQIGELQKELEALEKERFKEFKKRQEDKEKDERRRMEFHQFCDVVDRHSKLLDLTIKNCDSAVHCCNLTGEFVQSGFNALRTNFEKKDVDYNDLLLLCHKQHLETFRGLYLSLGELIHKKEKRIEEVDKSVQTSHIQQEIASDTLNPNAKKFSDAKKQLLRVRDDIQEEVKELKQRATVALQNFKASEQALHDAEVEFVHPVVEHQQQELETKAKIVEYKALSVGHTSSAPIRGELEELKRQLEQTKAEVSRANRSTTGAMMSTLPSLRSDSPL